MRKLLLLFTCCCFFTAGALAQTNTESGSQRIINYSPKEYNAQEQNFAIAQDEKGMMYFGNTLGLLEFDGSTWRLYPVPNKTTIRSLAIDSGGKIYAGAQGDLGYFLPDSSGRLTFHSLMDFLPKDKRDFSDVWNAYTSGGKVYFRTDNYILIWDIKKKEFKILKSESGFHQTFLINGKLYAREWGKGLEVLKGDSLALLKGGEKFANERIYVMLSFPGKEGTILIVTRTMGLFKYDGNNFIPFKTEADKFIKDNRVYFPGTVLSDGNILLGTINGGAVVIDTAGREVRRYNLGNGIINNGVYFTFQDRLGAIWLATGNGISRIDYSSSVSYFDSRNNFSTIPQDIIRHNGIIYTATNNGVYSLDPNTSMLNLLKNSNIQSWSFVEMGDDLLIGTNDGLFKVENDKLTPVRKTIGNEYVVDILKRSGLNINRVYVATSSGLWSVLKSGNKWIDEGQILKNSDIHTSIEEDKDGRVWMGTYSSGMFRIAFQHDDKGNTELNKPVIEHFDKTNGLQEGYTYVEQINGINYFATNDSFYKFNENKKIFYPDTSDKIISAFYKITDNNNTFFQQDSLGRMWIGPKGKLAMGTLQPDGSWKWVSSPFNRFADETIYSIYAEKNGVTWFGTGSGIIKYDFGKKNSVSTDYPALVRSVEIGGDSTIYFGGKVNNPAIPEITFKNNSIKFRYAATSYEGKNINQFKTFLDGFDKVWSQWSTETTKEYTNLPPGKYTFKVAALNILGNESSTGIYSFEIIPPWFRTWWAYSLYAIVFCLLAFVFIRLQRSRVIAKERERSEFREAKLRAEAENEQRKNIELISEMGKDITASLSVAHIIDTVYNHVNKLMDASVFGIGIYNKDKQQLDFPATREKGKALPAYSYRLDDTTRPASWCFTNKNKVFINDFKKEHQAYISDIPEEAEGVNSESLMYLPLIYKDKSIGVITSQSFNKNAYNEYHLNVLRSLATYTAVALDNADAYRKLQSTQAQLIQSEKMASLGELTAGIAHEIQNPLNFVNNFSEVNKEMLEELKAERLKPNAERNQTLEDELINDVIENEEKINHHGKRADAIVKGMLQHSKQTKGVKEPTDINALCDEYLRLSYHGMRAKDKSFNADFKSDFDETIGKINIVSQDIGRVILNLLNNAFYAVNERQKKAGENYKPTVSIQTKKLDDKVEIIVSDNGNGISSNIIDKIYQPFFTTKPTGQGTGLGLSLAYDIIKTHDGEIKVETKNGEGSEFIITLSLKA